MNRTTQLCFVVIALMVSGCSKQSQVQPAATSSTPDVVQAAAPTPLPALSEQNDHQVWTAREIPVQGPNGSFLGTLRVKQVASLDGRFDLTIDTECLTPCGAASHIIYVKFSSHGHYDALMTDTHLTDKLMHLRIAFDDGSGKDIEWIESTNTTNDILANLLLYPAKAGVPIGPIMRDSYSSGDGYDFLQDMLAHKAVLVEVKPGVTTQFDLTGLPQVIEAARIAEQARNQAADQAGHAAMSAATILDSLNIDDVIDRCGQPDNTVTPSLEPYLTYSNAFNTGPVMGKEFSTVDIFFRGTTQGTHIDYPQVDATPYGSHHSRPISKNQLTEVLPCLLKGGIAK